MGVTSVPASQQGMVTVTACGAVVVGACGMYGRTVDGGHWGGGALALGTGWQFGPQVSSPFVGQ
jgi:hypothetical protein